MKKNKSTSRRYLKRMPIIVANLFTFIITVVIFSNSIELISEIDIPYAYSIKTFSGSSYLNDSNYHGFLINQQNKLTSNYGNPKVIKFSSINKRLELLNPIVKDKKFLVRTNKAHQLMDKNGNIVIYLLKSWKTVDEVNELSRGDNIFLDSDKGWRYVYRIEEINQSELGNNIILPTSEDPQLLIVIEDSKNNANYSLRCQYLTVINIQR